MNTSIKQGGVLAVYDVFNMTITDCEFYNNTALSSGGAIVIGN
jgi:hypothetical protein